MPQILPTGEIREGISSLNLKQGEVFNVVIHGPKILQNLIGIMLSQSTYFFWAVKAQVNLIW